MKELDTRVLDSSMQTLSLLLLCPAFSVLLMKVVMEQIPQVLNIHWMCLQKLKTITLCASADAMGGIGLGQELPPLLALIFFFFLLQLSSYLFISPHVKAKIFLSSCALSLGKHLPS